MYSSQYIFNKKTTHIFIKGSNNLMAISKINKKILNNRELYIFSFQELTYEIKNGEILPLCINIEKDIR